MPLLLFIQEKQMNYDRLVSEMQIMRNQLERIENKLERALYEDDQEDRYDHHVVYTEEQIKANGQRVAYNRITDPRDVVAFKNFVYFIRKNPGSFSKKEIDYAGFADKAFNDIRLSDNHVRILSGTYMRLNGTDWPWEMTKGYMYKYNDQIAWEWL